MKQGDDVPAELLGGTGWEGGIEITRDGEQRADDVVGLELVGFDQRAQQLVGGGENLLGIVAVDRGGSANAVEPD